MQKFLVWLNGNARNECTVIASDHLEAASVMVPSANGSILGDNWTLWIWVLKYGDNKKFSRCIQANSSGIEYYEPMLRVPRLRIVPDKE